MNKIELYKNEPYLPVVKMCQNQPDTAIRSFWYIKRRITV